MNASDVRGEAGAVGKMIVVWLIVLVVIGVGVIDAASIAMTTYRLDDVANSASSDGANAYQNTHNIGSACAAAQLSARTQDPDVTVGKHGCSIDTQTGRVTITLRKQAPTLVARYFDFTKRFAKVSATETNGPTAL